LPLLLLVPGPTFPSLELLLKLEEGAVSRRCVAAEPVVVPLCGAAMLRDAPGPTLPSLEAPGAGWFCASAPPADNASTQADTKNVFFIDTLLQVDDLINGGERQPFQNVPRSALVAPTPIDP
jgi:hypothetical protein